MGKRRGSSPLLGKQFTPLYNNIESTAKSFLIIQHHRFLSIKNINVVDQVKKKKKRICKLLNIRITFVRLLLYELLTTTGKFIITNKITGSFFFLVCFSCHLWLTGAALSLTYSHDVFFFLFLFLVVKFGRVSCGPTLFDLIWKCFPNTNTAIYIYVVSQTPRHLILSLCSIHAPFWQAS